MKMPNKIINKVITSVVKKSLMCNANSTTSMIYYQPKAPATLKNFSKINKE